WPALLGAGVNSSPINCATVRLSPMLTGVVPSARSTAPLDGSAVTVTLTWDAGKLASVGVGIPIAIAALSSATARNIEFSLSAAMLLPRPLDPFLPSQPAKFRPFLTVG